MAIQPVQLFHVENRRRRRDPGERKFSYQLGHRKNLARAAGRSPSEQRQIIYQRFGEDSHVAEVGDRSSAVTFRQPLAIGAEDRGEMREFWSRPTQGFVYSDLL